MHFIRSWIERPLSIGAVKPSSKMLARTMARYVDPHSEGPVVELGPGTGPVTEALVEAGIAPARLVLLEFNPTFCRILRARYPEATLVQGDAYSLRSVLELPLLQPAAAFVSGLPLVTKPMATRERLLREMLRPDAARRAVRAVHLFGHFTAADAARRLFGTGLGADLDEPAAGPGLGVPEDLTPRGQTTAGGLAVMLASVLSRPSLASSDSHGCSKDPLLLPAPPRAGSTNARLAALAAKEFALAEAEVTRISLAEYPLPLFDADFATDAGPPRNALRLREMLTTHQGIFITSPEYSASVTPLLKNSIDWISRVREHGEPYYAAFKGRVFALGSASPSSAGWAALVDGAAADFGARLRRAGDPRADQRRTRRAGVR